MHTCAHFPYTSSKPHPGTSLLHILHVIQKNVLFILHINRSVNFTFLFQTSSIFVLPLSAELHLIPLAPISDCLPVPALSCKFKHCFLQIYPFHTNFPTAVFPFFYLFLFSFSTFLYFYRIFIEGLTACLSFAIIILFSPVLNLLGENQKMKSKIYFFHSQRGLHHELSSVFFARRTAGHSHFQAKGRSFQTGLDSCKESFGPSLACVFRQ